MPRALKTKLQALDGTGDTGAFTSTAGDPFEVSQFTRMKPSSSTPTLNSDMPEDGPSGSPRARRERRERRANRVSQNGSAVDLQLPAAPAAPYEQPGNSSAPQAQPSAPASQQQELPPLHVETFIVDVNEGVGLTSNTQVAGQRYKHELIWGLFWKVLLRVVAIAPWKVIKGCSYVLNKWQRFVSPISYGIFTTGDLMDKQMPTVKAILVWFWNTLSLGMHFVDVILCFCVMQILSKHGHATVSGVMGSLYIISHYLMGVIMYMEHDRAIDSPVYTALDFINFLRRQVDVLFYDIQLLASVVHSNIMIEGMTQMVLQGYEEARVCIHLIMNTIPTAIILGVLYDTLSAFRNIEFEDVWSRRTYLHVVYAAFALAVLNAVDKFIRLSLADPWLHPLNKDGYPLLYMRSSAARLPRALQLDFIFRCNVALADNDDKLVLRPLYDKYVVNSRGEAKPLADGHKAHLLRKALRTFNSTTPSISKAEVIARQIDKRIMRPEQALASTRTVHALDASNLAPGPHFASMLQEVLMEASGFDWLSLADNGFKDAAASTVMEGLRSNSHGLKIRHLDLSGNDIDTKGAEAVAAYIMQIKSLVTLNLSNNPLSAPGAKALAAVLAEDTCLTRLDLSGTNIGGDGASALGSMLKSNKTLRELLLSGTKIGVPGVEAIVKGVTRNSCLRELDLSRTATDDKAATAIAQMLMSNVTLQRLNLSATKITDAGAKVLIDALQTNHGLQSIDITGCPMDKQWRKLLGNITRGA